MTSPQNRDCRDPQFSQELENIHKKFGRAKLTDDDLVLLVCDEISRTSTREEKMYSS